MRKMFLFFFLFTVIGVAGCTKSDSAKTPGDEEGDAVYFSIVKTGEMTTCAEDDDCTTLQYSCCSCAGPEAVNKAYTEEVTNLMEKACKKAEEDNAVCIAMYCMPKEAECVDNKCAVSETGGAPGDDNGDGAGDSGGERWTAPAWLTGEMSECSANNDCMIASWGCCDYCNGGKPVPINKNYSETVNEQNKDNCGEETMCTLMACVNIPAICFNNKCDMFLPEDTDVKSPINTCSSDSDCTYVSMDCCDYCNGGEAAAVNNAYKDVLIEYRKQFICPYACTQKGCGPPVTSCVEGMCAFSEGS